MKKISIALFTLLLTLNVGCYDDDVIELPQRKTTEITDENYALAETQVIFTDYARRIRSMINDVRATGHFLHNLQGPDPEDKTVVRLNFDTRYSFAIIDLNEEVELVMPETNGRYQSAWLITEEHYNPLAITQPGHYKLTKEMIGTRYAMILLRTQGNAKDPKDMEIVTELQKKVQLNQKPTFYIPSHSWDLEQMITFREKYSQIALEENIPSSKMFGKKGEVELIPHNCGAAMGWGGMTADQALYLNYVPEGTKSCTLTLKDVPIADNAFWSVTIYDDKGFPRGENFNINSSFAKKNADGSVTIHFGGDAQADNYMEIYEGWNFLLRLYLPQEAYFNGTWKKPNLVYCE